MKNIRIKCPAKINLTLEIVNRREDGFHNINSIMQLISLFDFLEISVEDSLETIIELSGTSPDIPYNEKNLVYKAANLFLETTGIEKKKIKIFIEKNIPIAAGLAGGSTDAAGTLYGLNLLFNQPLTKDKLNELCSKLGSDLNVCLQGGCQLATSRGEKTSPLPVAAYPVTLIKPRGLGISAKEAYTKYAEKKEKLVFNNTEKMITALKNGTDIKEYLYNDLEYAIFDDYRELQTIKKSIPNSIMSGSGSTYFVLEKNVPELSGDFDIYPNLEFIDFGCLEATF